MVPTLAATASNRVKSFCFIIVFSIDNFRIPICQNKRQ